MFTWPENILPLPAQSFDVDEEYNNLRSSMDSGRVRQRPRFSRPIDLSTLRFELTQAQRAYFRAVWIHKLNNGNDWFTMRLPVANDEALTLVEIRFVGNPRVNLEGFEHWTISVPIEYREAIVITENSLDLAIFYSGDKDQMQQDAQALADVFPADWTL